MTNTYVDKSYAYAVARLRHAELKLLDGAFMEQLISAKTTEDAVRILKAEYFTRTRKASIILMLFNKKMYAFLAGKWNQVV